MRMNGMVVQVIDRGRAHPNPSERFETVIFLSTPTGEVTATLVIRSAYEGGKVDEWVNVDVAPTMIKSIIKK